MPPTKRRRKRPARVTAAAAPVEPTPAVDFRTDERRIRVRELWGRKQIAVALLLLDEGFPVNVGEPPLSPLSKGKQEEWQARRVEAMRRNVSNDRTWWEEKWRERSKIPKGGEDVAVERESYVAALESDLDQIEDDITAKETKATAKAILHGERRQTRALIAKARGIDQIAELPTNEKPKVPVTVFIGTSKVSPEMKAQLKSQGVDIE